MIEPDTSHLSLSELDTAGSMSADGGMLGIAGYGSDAESDIVVESEAAPDPDAAAGPAADAGQRPFSKLSCRNRATHAGQGQACSSVLLACEQRGPQSCCILAVESHASSAARIPPLPKQAHSLHSPSKRTAAQQQALMASCVCAPTH